MRYYADHKDMQSEPTDDLGRGKVPGSDEPKALLDYTATWRENSDQTATIEILCNLAAALRTLSAQLTAANERAERAEDKFAQCNTLLSPIIEWGQSGKAGIGLGESITKACLDRAIERDTLAARLAEVERATEVANQQLFESRMQTSYIEARADAAEQALAEPQVALARCPYRHVIDQWLICDNQEGATGNAEADWHRLRVAMWQEWLDPQISEEAAKLVERGRTEALAGLGELEWEGDTSHIGWQRFNDEAEARAWQDGGMVNPDDTPQRTIRAIRRVLDTGGAGNG